MINFKINKVTFTIQEDRAILMVCIGIALVFWLLVKLSGQYFMEKKVNIAYSIPEEKTFSKMPPDDMTARISGSGWALLFSYFSTPEITLYYNLTEASSLNLTRGQLRSDLMRELSTKDLNVVELNYDLLDAPLEEKMKKKVPVKLNSAFKFAAQYRLQDTITLMPDSVMLVGPRSILEQQAYWETDSLILEDLKGNLVQSIPLKKAAPEIELNQEVVEVTIQVEQITEKSILVPLIVKNAPDSLKIFPSSVKLTFVVGLSDFNMIQANDFQVEVDLKNAKLKGDKNSTPIALTKFPENVEYIQFSPKSAEYYFIKEAEPESDE